MKELEKKILDIINKQLLTSMSLKEAHECSAKEIAALIDPYQEEIRRLRFMIDNGLGWEDIRDDITMPHEI